MGIGLLFVPEQAVAKSRLPKAHNELALFALQRLQSRVLGNASADFSGTGCYEKPISEK